MANRIRDGFTTRVEIPRDTVKSLTGRKKTGYIIVEVRCTWPGDAPREAVLEALANAYRRAHDDAMGELDTVIDPTKPPL